MSGLRKGLESVPCLLIVFLVLFFFLIMKQCRIPSNAFSVSIEIFTCFSNVLSCWYGILHWSSDVKPTLHSRIHLSWLWHGLFLYVTGFGLVEGSFASVFVGGIGLQFYFLLMSLSGFGIRLMLGVQLGMRDENSEEAPSLLDSHSMMLRPLTETRFQGRRWESPRKRASESEQTMGTLWGLTLLTQ